MNKLLVTLSLAAMLTAGQQAMADGEFTPEAGVKYSFRPLNSEFVAASTADGSKTVMITPKRAQADNFEYTLTASGDGFTIMKGDGTFACKSGWQTSYVTEDKAGIYHFVATDDGENTYRIGLISGGNAWWAADNLGENAGIFSDKSETNALGIFQIIKSSEITYSHSIKAMTVNIEKENDGDNSATGRFTPMNFSGTVTLTASEGFTVTPATLDVTDGTEATFTVTTGAAEGTQGTVTVTYDGNAVGTIDVNVVATAPTYYIMNNELGMVLGGNTEMAQCVEMTMEDSQKFKKVEVPGTDRFYLIQKSTGLYFRNVDSGSGVEAHACEYGASAERAEWSFPEVDGGVRLKNSKQDRVAFPMGSEHKIYCYATSEPAAVWQLLPTDQFVAEPTVDISNTNVVVEQNGMSFTTDVRAYNLDGGAVNITASPDVTLSTTVLTDSYQRTPLTISATAAAGTACWVDFKLNDQLLNRLEFTVSPRFDRYVVHLVQEAETDLVIGSDADSAQPILMNFEEGNILQHIIVMPADPDAGTVYLIQEGSYGYLTHTGNGWSTTFGPANGENSVYTLEGMEENPDAVQIRGCRGLLDTDNYAAGENLYCNKSKGTWRFEALGQISVTPDNVILDNRQATATVTVKASGLSEDITVTTTGAAKTNVTTLEKKGGEIVVSLDPNSTETSGTVTFTSGLFSAEMTVRLRAMQVSVDKTEIEINGKGSYGFFTVTGQDFTEPIKITTEGEGFAVNVAEIPAATETNTAVTVSYSGTTAAQGKVIVTCGDVRHEVKVKVTFNPDIVITKDSETLVFDEGMANFAVTPVDLFEPVVITADTDAVTIEPATVEADAKDQYVFVTAKDAANVPALVTITLKAASVEKTLTIEKGEVAIEGVEADEAEAVYYNLQGVRVANPANGLFIRVCGDKVAKVAIK